MSTLDQGNETPDRVCTLLGCRSSATVVINHAKHGERPVCDDCAGGHEVIADV